MSITHTITPKKKFKISELNKFVLSIQDATFKKIEADSFLYWVKEKSTRGVYLTIESYGINVRNTLLSNSYDYELTNDIVEKILLLTDGGICDEEERGIRGFPLFDEDRINEFELRDCEIIQTLAKLCKKEVTIGGPEGNPIHFNKQFYEAFKNLSVEEFRHKIYNIILTANYKLTTAEDIITAKEVYETKRDIDNAIYGIGINSFNRFEAFLRIKDYLPDKLYWYALKEAYSSSDDLYRYKEILRDCFVNNRKYKKEFMDWKEQKLLSSLPQFFTIYRGMTEQELESQDFGVSWTLDKSIAEFFAFVYNRNSSTHHLKKIVVEAYIEKEFIIGIINNRNEKEIIVDPIHMLEFRLEECKDVNRNPKICDPVGEKIMKKYLLKLKKQ